LIIASILGVCANRLLPETKRIRQVNSGLMI